MDANTQWIDVNIREGSFEALGVTVDTEHMGWPTTIGERFKLVIIIRLAAAAAQEQELWWRHLVTVRSVEIVGRPG